MTPFGVWVLTYQFNCIYLNLLKHFLLDRKLVEEHFSLNLLNSIWDSRALSEAETKTNRKMICIFIWFFPRYVDTVFLLPSAIHARPISSYLLCHLSLPVFSSLEKKHSLIKSLFSLIKTYKFVNSIIKRAEYGSKKPQKEKAKELTE